MTTKTVTLGDTIDYERLNSQPRLTISQEQQAQKHYVPVQRDIVDYSDSDCGAAQMVDEPSAPPVTCKLHR